MVQPFPQIFDILSGEANGMPSLRSPQGDGNGEGVPFALLMNDLLIGGEGEGKSLTPNGASENNAFGSAFSPELFGMISDESGQVQTDRMVMGMAPLPGASVFGILPEENTSALSTLFAAANKTFSGTYEVLDWSVEDDALVLTVQSKEKPFTPFEVSLPLTQVESLLSAAGSHTVASSEKVVADIEKYLAQLNLKEITVTQVDALESDTPYSGMKVTIHAETGTGDKELVLPLRSAPVAVTVKPVTLSGKMKSVKEFERKPLPLKTGTRPAERIESEMLSPQEAVARPAYKLNQQPFREEQLFEKMFAKQDNTTAEVWSGNENSPALQEKPYTTQPFQHRPVEVRPVRFTLPETIATTLKPNGRMVTLQIEPAHLGPARLSLVMYRDKLHARVVVRDTAAKAAVEASLERLHEQLARANVEVEHIEVTIGGDGARDSHFNRRYYWQRRLSKAGRGTVGTVSSLPPLETAPSPLPRTASFVGAEGVNVLA